VAQGSVRAAQLQLTCLQWQVQLFWNLISQTLYVPQSLRKPNFVQSHSRNTQVSGRMSCDLQACSCAPVRGPHTCCQQTNQRGVYSAENSAGINHRQPWVCCLVCLQHGLGANPTHTGANPKWKGLETWLHESAVLQQKMACPVAQQVSHKNEAEVAPRRRLQGVVWILFTMQLEQQLISRGRFLGQFCYRPWNTCRLTHLGQCVRNDAPANIPWIPRLLQGLSCGPAQVWMGLKWSPLDGVIAAVKWVLLPAPTRQSVINNSRHRPKTMLTQQVIFGQ